MTCRHILLGQTVRLSDWVTLSDFCGTMWRLGSDYDILWLWLCKWLWKHHHFAVASEGSRIWWCTVRGSYRNFVETLCRKLVDSCDEMLCVIRFTSTYFSVVSNQICCLLESVMRLCKSRFERMRGEMHKCRLQASLMFWENRAVKPNRQLLGLNSLISFKWPRTPSIIT